MQYGLVIIINKERRNLMPPEVLAAQDRALSSHKDIPFHHAWKIYMSAYNNYQRNDAGKFLRDNTGNFIRI